MSKPHPGGTLEIETESDLVASLNDVSRLREDLTDLSDDSLISLSRSGSADAYAELFERYRRPATRLAAYYSNSVDANDIVAESFAQVYDLLRRGKGPETSFRAYLFTSVRREAGRQAKMRKRVTPTDDVGTMDRAMPFGNGAVDGIERELVRDAFASLPQRWQTVLWHLDVDGRKPREVAPILGMKPNSVSALAYRAREGLRKAYLEQHIKTTTTPLPASCREVRSSLADFVRGTATERDTTAIESHLETCATCKGAQLELKQLNEHLGAVSGAIALTFAAPAAAGLVSSVAAKMLVFAKTAAAATGSTAAVVVTSVAVLHIPLDSPAGAATVHQQPTTATARQHEPDRSSGPAADQSLGRPVASGLEMAQSGSSDSAGSMTTDGSGPGQGQTDGSSSSEGSSSGGGSQPVTINVGSTNVSASVGPDKVSASVSAAGVKASVDVDIKKPLDTRVTVGSDKSKNQLLDTRKVTNKVSGTVKNLTKAANKNLNKGAKKD